MDLGLRNKVAMVAAASKGIGKACAMALAKEKAIVSMCARREDVLNAAAVEIRQASGSEVLALPIDLTKPEQIRQWVDETLKSYGKIDILVTNAGGPPPSQFINTTDNDWQNAIDLTLMSTIRMIRAVIPHMQQNGGGRIINITSVAVFQPVGRLLTSNTIRPAVHGLTKTLSDQYAVDNILINNVCPGYTLTNRVEQLLTDQAEKRGVSREAVLESFGQEIPLQRMAEPEEIANPVLFYASQLATYVTGTSLPVDGGYIKGTF